MAHRRDGDDEPSQRRFPLFGNSSSSQQSAAAPRHDDGGNEGGHRGYHYGGETRDPRRPQPPPMEDYDSQGAGPAHSYSRPAPTTNNDDDDGRSPYGGQNGTQAAGMAEWPLGGPGDQPLPRRQQLQQQQQQQTGSSPERRDGSRGSSAGGLGDASRNGTFKAGNIAVSVKPMHKKSSLRRAGESARQGLGRTYKKVVLEGIFRQKPLPRSKDGRHIPITPGDHPPANLLDERTGKPYVSNFIRSSRYTLWNFFPNQIIFQFSKLANFYFLVMGIMQVIPGLSTTGRFTTLGPLIVFVAFSMAKEGYDDYRRYVQDKAENRSDAWVLGSGREVRGKKDKKPARAAAASKRRAEKLKRQNSPLNTDGHEVEMGHYSGLESAGGSPVEEDWARIQWQDVRVGDIIRLQRDDAVPADMVLLHATGPNQVAYIETMALDGETNLKSKQSCPLLGSRCRTVEGLKTCEAEIVSEDPNLDLYSYDGQVIVQGEKLPVTLNNVVYRGSAVRNTADAYGLVINTGEECKIRMNAHKGIRAKSPRIQWRLNKIVMWLVFVVVALSGGLTAGYYIWRDQTERLLWFLMGETLTFKEVFIAFLLMFNTLIPLSLYVSLEIIKIGQLYLLGDVDMYDPVSNTPMSANTMTILEDLGQVNYVFSDKTGTLTENMMRFRKMSVAGTAWLHDMDIKRDEAERQRKIDLSRKKAGKKKMEKATAEPAVRPRGMEDSIQMDELESPTDLEKTSASPAPPTYARAPSSQAQYPELKTEQLLQYMRERPNTSFARKTRHFLLCMALCNTCLPEIKENGEIDYQASSPDELALVEAARDLGYEMIDRPAQFIKLRRPDENGKSVVETFEVLDVVEFTSKRKRMSIIIRMPDGRICVFCKGADSALMPRLKLNQMALQKQRQIERRASQRRSVEQGMLLHRRSSAVASPRNSLNLGRVSSSKSRPAAAAGGRTESGRSGDYRKLSAEGQDGYEMHNRRLGGRDGLMSPASPRSSIALSPPTLAELDKWIDDSVATNDGTVFERCFQHTDDFATDGLRTLLFASRHIEEDEYRAWKKVYAEAETSLVDRQERVEAAGELIEDKFDLVGVTAIEDKLQDGVPDTIDKLRRANIKVWMLTGDKRETAINIGHSAKVTKPYSEIYILDVEAADEDLLDKLTRTLAEVAGGTVPHSVVVVDGGTLAAIDADADGLAAVFYELVVRVDSVICCRASPSQKADLVRRIRDGVPQSMTLAIGDGANDISMILAAQVGIGISGREGLQAARSADFSIAQFRFLQKLLFVHGRWNYMRTGKYFLATFWKEIFFFTIQAHYQRWAGYTGTSLFENWSLTVFNGVFTSIPVWILGILDQDLKPTTLVKFPELYRFGQLEKGFNFWMYLGWSVIGAFEAAILFYGTWAVYWALPSDQDTSLYAMGSVSFTVGVIFINVKLLVLEMHYKTIIAFAGLLLSVCGWFVWNFALGAIYPNHLEVYQVHSALVENFGTTLNYWATMVLLLLTLLAVELFWSAVRRVYFPNDVDIMQRIERDSRALRTFEEDVERQRLEDEDPDGGNGPETAPEKHLQQQQVGGAATPPPPTTSQQQQQEQQQQQQQQHHGRRPGKPDEYAAGNWRRPSGDYNNQQGIRSVSEEEPHEYSPPQDRQYSGRADGRWV